MRLWQVTELGEPDEVMPLVESSIPNRHPASWFARVLASPANFPMP